MMKHITLALAALLSSGPLAADEEKARSVVIEEQVVIDQRLGKETIAQIRSGYEEGRYDEFLKEMDRAYETGVEENKVAGLAHLRSETAKLDEKWVDAAQALQKERNAAFAKIVAEQPGVFADRVRSTVAQITTHEQDKALLQLTSLSQKMPGSGANEDENRLIDLNLEY